MRAEIRTRHYSPRTEKAYVAWVRRFVFFHGVRHPDEMGAAEVKQFLSALATRYRVSASTQNQAFCALLFLYRGVLKRELTGLEDVAPRAGPRECPWYSRARRWQPSCRGCAELPTSWFR